MLLHMVSLLVESAAAATCRLLLGSEAGGEGDALHEGEGVEHADSKAACGEHRKSAVQGVGKPAVARVDDVPNVIDLRQPAPCGGERAAQFL